MLKVLCVGSATIDTFLTIDEFGKPGDKILVKKKEIHTGGGATNVALTLKKLNIDVKICSKLGDDHDGDFITKELKKYKIKNVCKHKSQLATDFSTLLYSVKVKDRTIYVHKGASNDLKPLDIPFIRTEWIYLASLLNVSFNTTKELIKRKSAKVAFNPSLYLAKKGKTYLQPILNKTEILILNLEEAKALLNTDGKPEFLLKKLQKLGPPTVIITNGSKPFQALQHNSIYKITPPKVKKVDTTGAGDCFAASFLAAQIKGYDMEKSLRLAQTNASSLIQEVGTKHGLLTEKQIDSKRYKIPISKKTFQS